MPDAVVIPKRFNGPPKSGHGGYVAGIVAELIGSPAEVTLRKPPPLDVPLSVVRVSDGIALCDSDGEKIATGTRVALDLDIPEPPDLDAAVRARAASSRLKKGAPFPTCVACGPERAAGDGLRIFAGPVEGRDLVAAPWSPDPSLVEDDGRVAERFLWAALDCPSYGALELGHGPPRALLGQICGSVTRPLKAGEDATIIAWQLGANGRKFYSASALFSQGGDLCAYARMTWIEIR